MPDIKLEANREICKNIKTLNGCVICQNRISEVLDFHHVDPENKDFTVSQWRGDLDTLQEEINKCVVVCSNCHRMVHAGLMALPPKSILEYYRRGYKLPPTRKEIK